MRREFDTLSRGLFLITLGLVFILINYGLLSWHFWLRVIDLWPLVLILAGIGLVFNRRIPFSAILLIFLLCMLVYSLAVGDRPMPWTESPSFERSTIKSTPINYPYLPDTQGANYSQEK
ncbi:DUF5668 domain-containing protein [Desulfosporosinus sp. PR]|uniref:LiaF transmembrane domain-containing protein n=1 Tax=Candidatus Desulfosporosinus nitrosoreducens TaxID=3401928 RepID=UPI0027FFF4B6|nr:DUF5668 domain-containing protein [Desulfosporosinus sp. PR]MDQ7095842.1 DUF5668 domain-containing protein [Desulfosporosinus sp. PR]